MIRTNSEVQDRLLDAHAHEARQIAALVPGLECDDTEVDHLDDGEPVYRDEWLYRCKTVGADLTGLLLHKLALAVARLCGVGTHHAGGEGWVVVFEVRRVQG